MQCVEHRQKGNAGGARALGREFGVSNSTVRDVLKQRTWKEN